MFKEIAIANQLVPKKYKNGIIVYVKREDLLHQYISGNKFRKLKYNLIYAKQLGKKTLLTFGGAYSNHIAATAAAGKEFGFNTIGVIRGEELVDCFLNNPTLNKAHLVDGMQLEFISRQQYRNKTDKKFINQLIDKFGDFYLIPEGGTNNLAVKGCQEILKPDDSQFDYICCAVGTGGTIAGIINSSAKHQKVIGFPALKGDFLFKEIAKLTEKKDNWDLILDYHFGGYAKTNTELFEFIDDFNKQTTILLDPIYTGKMLFGIEDLIDKGYFKENSKILAIHTGGLQGWNEVIRS